MHALIEQHLAGIAAICKRYRIARLEVFGSGAQDGEQFSTGSDADFLVQFATDARTGLDEFFGAKSELEGLLGREVDLVEAGAVRNPYVLRSIDRSRELIYVA